MTRIVTEVVTEVVTGAVTTGAAIGVVEWSGRVQSWGETHAN